MKILLIDDHSLFREGMRHVLKQLDDSPVVIEASSSKEGLALARQHNDLDIVLLDLNMPETGGFETLSLFRANYPAVAVVVLTASEDYQDAKTALDIGAVGYIPKSATSQVMLGAVKLIRSGGVYVPPLILNQMSQLRNTPVTPSITPPTTNTAITRAATVSDSGTLLTGRQMEVLVLLAQGKSNKEIGRDLGMAEGTVKIHVTAIFKALSVVNRTQAVLAAKKWA